MLIVSRREINSPVMILTMLQHSWERLLLSISTQSTATSNTAAVPIEAPTSNISPTLQVHVLSCHLAATLSRDPSFSNPVLLGIASIPYVGYYSNANSKSLSNHEYIGNFLASRSSSSMIAAGTTSSRWLTLYSQTLSASQKKRRWKQYSRRESGLGRNLENQDWESSA